MSGAPALSVYHLASTDEARGLMAARRQAGSSNCGWPDAPHLVFSSGWICLFCGYDTRPDGTGWGWPDATEYDQGPFKTCECADPSGWAEWGDVLYCMTCSRDVDSGEAKAMAQAAADADPEYLDVLDDLPPVGAS